MLLKHFCQVGKENLWQICKNVDKTISNEQILDDFVMTFNKKIKGVESIKVEQCKLDALINQIDDKIDSVNAKFKNPLWKLKHWKLKQNKLKENVVLMTEKDTAKMELIVSI